MFKKNKLKYLPQGCVFKYIDVSVSFVVCTRFSLDMEYFAWMWHASEGRVLCDTYNSCVMNVYTYHSTRTDITTATIATLGTTTTTDIFDGARLSVPVPSILLMLCCLFWTDQVLERWISYRKLIFRSLFHRHTFFCPAELNQNISVFPSLLNFAYRVTSPHTIYFFFAF